MKGKDVWKLTSVSHIKRSYFWDCRDWKETKIAPLNRDHIIPYLIESMNTQKENNTSDNPASRKCSHNIGYH